ncbi:tail needle knob [Citrobacter phage IME-CF2]|uniref:Sf6-type phage tail needle knob domain-containing protein n=3 Tax=Pseudotevenvirus TaxID=2842979 RepID=A0A1B1IXF0_9CAUD|nr:tail needle knob [Citrobacter phage Miller]YP_009218613.1 tail needle knob [Citrobacter phage IME-CF2]YP_009285665.1 tail needle knob [Citrobacter phage vB_CfrM_CfP1]AIK68066.1 hypothetical protein CPTMiller_00130 [Citrobacter phage Miller]AKR15921.1 hypothetical protein [Citrobacter phage IME-CF2]ANS05994.1 hypothetical protein ABCD_0127 [Citrobacter phage vB_CfrM_CfP1]
MLISADSVDELNQKVNQLLDQGMYLWGSPFVVPNSYHNQTRFFQQVSNVNPSGGGVDGKSAYQLWLEQPGNAGKPITDFFAATAGVRKKSEVFWTGLTLVVPEDTPTNLINLLKTIVPTTGTLEPFFKITDNKLHPFNEDATVQFKLNLKGTFTGAATAPRSVTLDFVGTQGNTLVLNRSQSVTTSTLSFVTFFSVDKNGNMATNGTAINIFASGSPFTLSEVLLVAEQRTTQ